MKGRKQKVVSVSEEGLIGIRIMAARLGVSTRMVCDMILDAVGMDLELQDKIMECQEKDLERKENQNGTSGKSIPGHRKMNPDHRKMTSEETAEIVPDEVVKEIKEEEEMLKSYKTKASVPNSISLTGNDNGEDASPVPLLTEVEGIKGVPSGGYVVRGDKLYMSYANKMYETRLGDKNKVVHLEIDGKKIKIDTAKKLGSL
jgi:hypothetical protein